MTVPFERKTPGDLALAESFGEGIHTLAVENGKLVRLDRSALAGGILPELGLGSLAVQDADDVDISGGAGVFSTLGVTGELSVFGAGSETDRLKATYDSASGIAWFGPDRAAGNSQLRFGTTNAGAFSERMRIASDGSFTLSGNVFLAGRRIELSNISDLSNQGIRFADSVSGKLWNIAPGTAGGLFARFFDGSDWRTRLMVDASGAVTLGGGAGSGSLVVPTVPTAVNYMTIEGAATGNATRIYPQGADGQINAVYAPKGSSGILYLCDNSFVSKFAVSSAGIGFFGTTGVAKPTITGSRGGNAALADLLTKLATFGLVTDGTTA